MVPSGLEGGESILDSERFPFPFFLSVGEVVGDRCRDVALEVLLLLLLLG